MARTLSAAETGRLQRWSQDGPTLRADYGGPVVSIRAISSDMLRIRFAPDGAIALRRSWAVNRPDNAYPAVPVSVTETACGPELRTIQLVAHLNLDGARLTRVERTSGRVILSDDSGGGPVIEEDGGARWVTGVADPGKSRFYGFGERTGLLERRGRRYSCWTTDRYEDQSPNTDELYLAIPFFLGLTEAGQSFGLFLNNTYRSAFELTRIDQGCLSLEVSGGELDYYFIYGPEPAAVVERFTELTGRMPLPPRWALGYYQSRWSYGSEAEVREIAGEFRRRSIPADAIYLDIDAMDRLRVFTWDPETFPDPAALASELRDGGFRLVSVMDVGVKRESPCTYQVYDEGVERDCFLKISRHPAAPLFLRYVWPGLCAFPDFTRPAVQGWWGDQYRALLDAGIAGVLSDMNEPALHDLPYDDPKTFRSDPPLDLPHGPPTEPADHAEVHNVYGSLEAKATYEAFRRHRPGERPFLISRGGFAGIQRHAAVWTGDNQSTWEHLEMSLPQLMNMGLSGVPFAGADIGGFYGNCEPELFARWMQLGAFYPFARGNSAKGTARQEPWSFGPEIEDVCRPALEQRYRLLPYFATVLHEASRTGLPFLRPLFLQYPIDPATHLLHDQALVGRDLMIAPIVRPGKAVREVYLPSGTWFDMRTTKQQCGPAHVLADGSLQINMPLYARRQRNPIRATAPVDRRAPVGDAHARYLPG